jgi:hypothetical protein
MKTILVRYKTSEAQSAANEALVHAVFDELRARSPKGLRYTTFRLADGVSWVHLASYDTATDDVLTALPAFKAFQKQLKERCLELPVATELTRIDGYDGAS